MKPGKEQELTRRGFIRGAGLLGLGGAATALADGKIARSAPGKTAAPVGMDLGRFGKIDPKLIGHKEVGRIPCPGEPKRVVVGPGDEVFATVGKTIVGLPKGHPITASEQIRSLAVGMDGVIYAGLKESIEVYDRKGQRLAVWKPEIKKPWFTSLAVGENDLFAADAANRHVFRFDRSGKLLTVIGEKIIVPSPYFDVEIGREGLLWVANPGQHRLEAYTFEGHLESFWGKPTFALDGFCGCCNPSYFTRLPDGRFITSEKGLVRIKAVSPTGTLVTAIAGLDAFQEYFQNVNSLPVALDVAADSKGRVYVADSLAGAVRVFERNT